MSEFPDAREREARLDRLFRAYREACPDPEPSVNFMPLLWERIEKTQSTTRGFRRVAQAFVTAAAALSLLMALLAVYPRQQSPTTTSTYVEVLAEHNDNNEVADADTGVL